MDESRKNGRLLEVFRPWIPVIITMIMIIAAFGAWYSRSEAQILYNRGQIEDHENRMRCIEQSQYRTEEHVAAIREDLQDIKEEIRNGG